LASGALKDTASGAPVALDRLLDIAIQIANGLEAAHEQGIVHRDIKPANIFITTKGVAKILDFGLAKLPLQPSAVQAIPAEVGGEQAVNRSRPVRAAGTAAYMSPEQVRGQQLDARTDLFSFGLILYEMATGRRAFTGDNAAALHDAILNRAPTPPAELNPELPTELQDVIQKCLEKDRNLRYQTAAEIRSALEKVKRRREHPVLRRWKLLTTAAVVVAALIAAGLYWRARKNTTLTAKDTIVLADFVNTTGDPVLDDSLKQALAIQLEQSPSLTVLSDHKVIETLKLMNRPANERVTRQVAEEVCLRNNSKSLLEGSSAPMGDHYLITLKATNCQTGDTIASADAEAESRNKILKAVTEVADALRRNLGESLASVQNSGIAGEDRTTSSLEALQAFARARKAQTMGGADTIPYLKRAVELDPNFAYAYASLGVNYHNLGQTSLASENFKKAYELRERVSPRERFFIEAVYYRDVTGELDKAIQTYTEWNESFPGDGVLHINLGSIFLEMGQYEKAAVEEREAIRIVPDIAMAYSNLMIAYNGLNRLDQSRATLDQAQTRKLDGPFLREYWYYLGFLQGDQSATQEQLNWAMGKAEMEDRMLSTQSDTEAYYGRFRKARDFSQRAVASATHAGTAENAASWRAIEALREAEIGNASRARQMASDALALSNAQDVRVKAALTFARAGEGVHAGKLATKLNQEFPLDTMMQNYSLPSIQAAIDLEKNNARGAIQILQVATPYDLGSASFGNLYPVYVRGLAYLKLGQGQQAAAEFQKVLDHRGIVGNFVIGALAHLQLGRAQAMMGDKEAARKSYQDFLTLWKDADPDIPILHAAKAEYAKLI
jgi:serine/threonine protein kinase/Tfp pilus assembly protein PilF